MAGITSEYLSPYSPEHEVRVLGETTYKELGIEREDDYFNFGSDKVTLAQAKGERPGSTINIIFDHHPYAGEHTSQLLNSVAPLGDSLLVKHAILADFYMPFKAEEEMGKGKGPEDSEAVRLHLKHLGDPRIGTIYADFVNQHLQSWYKNIENKYSSGGIYEVIQNGIDFISDIDEYTNNKFNKWKDLESNYENTFTFNDISNASAMAHGEKYKNFVLSKLNIPRDITNISSYFCIFPSEKKKSLLEEYFEDLTKEEKAEISKQYSARVERKLVADKTDRKILLPMYPGTIKAEFLEDNRVKLLDSNENFIELEESENQEYGSSEGRVSNYSFSDEYLSNALYPSIVWETDREGNRRFLRQEEARPYLTNLAIPEADKGDVKFGEIMSVYFSQSIVDNWRKQISLKPLGIGEISGREDFEQPMMAAQVPVWVVLQDHSKQLFEEKGGVFDKLEKGIAANARNQTLV